MSSSNGMGSISIATCTLFLKGVAVSARKVEIEPTLLS